MLYNFFSQYVKELCYNQLHNYYDTVRPVSLAVVNSASDDVTNTQNFIPATLHRI